MRRERRTLSDEELVALIHAARNSDKRFRRLTGIDRAMLYLTALGTGFRAGELASLTSASLFLEADPPVIELAASSSKRRKYDRQPLPSWLAGQLSDWLKSHGAPSVRYDGLEAKLWPGSWPDKAAEMLRIDLEAAGIPYVDDTDRPFDFHALRHQYITQLTTSGLHPKIAQQLARHSDINLTMKRYTHLNLLDVAGAVEQLDDPTRRQPAQNQATGTDDRHILLRSGCATPVNRGPKLTLNGKLGKIEESPREATLTLRLQGLVKRRARDSNPQPLAGHLISSQAASQFAYPPGPFNLEDCAGLGNACDMAVPEAAIL